MKIESAQKGGAEISGEQINKIGQFSYKNIRSDNAKNQRSNANTTPKQSRTCYYCGKNFSTSIAAHRERCPAKDATCNNCKKSDTLL